MLNKKTLFNGVYALGLFGAFTSCFGILNELLNLAQLYGKGVGDLLGKYAEKEFWIPLVYYFVTFMLCALTVTLLIFYLVGVLKQKDVWILNLCIIVACVVIFVMSLLLVYFLQDFNSYSELYRLSYYDYLTVYSFRSGAMSFIASAVVILFCNLIQARSQTKSEKNSTD